MKYPKIVQGNAFNAVIPLFMVNALGVKTPINAALISNLSVSIILRDKEIEDIEFTTAEHRVIIHAPEMLVCGNYSVIITGTLVDSGLRYARKYGFDIVPYQEQSCVDGIVSGVDVPLEDALFILATDTGDIQALEEQLRQAIAAAEVAKAEWQRKVEEISGVAKEAKATENKEEILQAIEDIPQPDLSQVAKEQTLTDKSREIITEVRKGGGNPSKTAYEAMKRLQPYLYSIEYSELDYEGARDYFATHFVPVNGSCTALRKGNLLGRNYDWKYNNEVEFLVRTKAHNGRFASIGVAGSISALTTSTIGEYSDEFKWMPFRLLDGMNEKGLTANVNMLNHDEERSLPQAGTTPLIEEREAICSAMLVRYILDNFATPQEACEYIRDYVRVYPPYSDGHTTDLHFALTNKEQLYYLCFEPDNNDVFRTMIADVKDQPLPFVMTNFRMWWASRIFDEETGHYDRFLNPDYDKVEKYAMGIERANLCLRFIQDTETEQSVLEFMREELAYTRSYFESTNPQWLTEFVGEYSEEDLARDSAATDFNRILGIVRQRYQERSRETALTWQTVHSVVYDLDTLTMQLVTQEGSVDDALTFDPFKALPASKGDLQNIDLSDVAKQGSNANATNTAILSLLESINARIRATNVSFNESFG